MSKKKIIIISSSILLVAIIIFITINIKNKNNIKILDTTYNCNKVTEIFYEDDNYTYSFDCAKSSFIYIEFPNGDKILLKNALIDELVTIDELEKAGLEFTKNKK